MEGRQFLTGRRPGYVGKAPGKSLRRGRGESQAWRPEEIASQSVAVSDDLKKRQFAGSWDAESLEE